MTDEKKKQLSLAAAIVGIVLAGLAAAWSLIGGACCGWGGWPLAWLGGISGCYSLYLRTNVLGWIAVAFAVFAFLWVFAGSAVLTWLLGAVARG